ncbi:MAG TPA: hypothetical protein VKS82_02780 [Streptosporangiaceae bacterium]|nr:hypothetical protein [Streptosporangiaceae bacterium]
MVKLPGRRWGFAAVGAGGVLAATVAIALAATQDPGGNVLTNGGGLSYGGIGSPPGLVADFPMQVQNTGSVPVTLESIALVPLPGYPTPRLVHAGVLPEHNDLLTSARGWPIWKGNSPSRTWRLLPLRGYTVLPWKTRSSSLRRYGPMPDMIEYGVLGSRLNTDYWVAGLRVTYRLGGNIYTQTLYDGGADCVGNFSFKHIATYMSIYRKYCAAVDVRANKELEKIAPQS